MRTESKATPLVSIVIDNYNYGRYLRYSIDSALEQSHPNTEVVVVDDGSSDNSAEVISSYRSRVVPVLKANGGQGSAFNAGFGASNGDVLIFLDADDVLLPTAAEAAVAALSAPGSAKAHWPLIEIDDQGRPTGRLGPTPLPEGDLSDEMIASGPGRAVFGSPPTSGNAWPRRLLKEILPMPEDLYTAWADTYLLTAASLFGRLRVVPEPQGLYRLHTRNFHATRPFAEKLERDLRLFQDSCRLIAEAAKRKGINVDPAPWIRSSWVGRVSAVVSAIAATVPPANLFLIADDGQIWMPEVEGRRAVPFPAAGGAPVDDSHAIREISQRQQEGVSHLVVAFPALWWMDYYRELSHWLAQYHLPQEDENLIIFELRR